MAAGTGFKDVAELLFKQGGVDAHDVDDVVIYGCTILDWACEKRISVPTGSEGVNRAWHGGGGSLVTRRGRDFPIITVAAVLCCYI